MAETPIRQQFLEGMSQTASTVNVVTTDGAGGRAGVTVSAMSSVSADTPRPSLLVCVHHMSAAAPAIVENGCFCVNVLRDDQAHISDTFGGRRKTADGDKFSCADWTSQVTGAPRVIDPLVAFDCEVMSSERVGTHHVFIGEVEDIFIAERGSPLIFSNRSYGTPSQIEPVELPADAPAQQLNVGCFHTFGPFFLPAIVRELTRCTPGLDLRLVEGDQRRIASGLSSGELEIGFLYDIDLDAELTREVLTEPTPYVLLPEGHGLARSEVISPEQLAGEPLVQFEAPPSRDYCLSVFKEAGVEPSQRFSSASFEMVRGMVGHGLGYSLLATKPASAMSYDGRALVARPLKTSVSARPIVLAHKQAVDLSPAAAELARLARNHFSSAKD